ncbi:hypothetical protein ACIBPB_33470 [Micromonospora sp. NPDC049836]|uniref:hypothetical protein n=1 Tax=Micromonospora sp. NPDC049836 TaxID=3364274 RepID=UPI0037BCEF1E
MADEEETSAVDIGQLLGNLLAKTYYGHAVGEVLSIALALESMIDSALIKALVKPDRETIAFATEKLFGQMGRERKFSLLLPTLQLVGAQNPGQICDRIKNLFQLRDKIAHSAIIEMTTQANALNLVGYRRGKLQTHGLTPELISKTIEEGQQAIQDLLPYSAVFPKPRVSD